MGPTAEPHASTRHVLAVYLAYALQAISLALFALADSRSASLLGCAVPAVVAAGIGLAMRNSGRLTSLLPHIDWQLRGVAIALLWALAIAWTSPRVARGAMGVAAEAAGWFALASWATYRVARGWMALRRGVAPPPGWRLGIFARGRPWSAADASNQPWTVPLPGYVGAWGVLSACVITTCAALAVALGKDANWDQLNYHVALPHLLLHGSGERNFFAANIHTWINPLPFLPFYGVVASGVPSAAGTALLAVVHAGSLLAVVALAALLTRGWHEGARLGAACGCAILAGMHPLFIAGLGSSLSEHVATVPMMWGLYLGCRLLVEHGAPPTRRAVYAASACALLVTAVLWKLALAALVPAFGILAAAIAWRRVDRLRVAGASVAGVLAGAGLGGAWHHIRVWEATGNPFFPFFNQVFRSEFYPPVALTNDRFLAATLGDAWRIPFRMLRNEPFITAEIVSIDPRYAFFGAVLAAACLARIVRQLRLAHSPGRGSATAAARQVPERGVPRRTLAAVVIFTLAGCALWIGGHGNARYALPLHLWVPVALLVVLRWVLPAPGLVLLVLGLAVGAQALALQASSGESRWTRVAHTRSWTDFRLPHHHLEPRALYLSAAYVDRRSWSSLLPSLPPDATFMNLDGYENTEPARFIGAQIRRRIDAHQGPLYAIVERRGRSAVDDPVTQPWSRGVAMQLLAYGLALHPERPCSPIQDMTIENRNLQTVGDLCPLIRTPARDMREAFATTLAAMDELEASHPKLLYPPGPASYLFEDMVCRFYTPQEIYLCGDDRLVTGRRIAPRQELVIQRTLQMPAGRPGSGPGSVSRTTAPPGVRP